MSVESDSPKYLEIEDVVKCFSANAPNRRNMNQNYVENLDEHHYIFQIVNVTVNLQVLLLSKQLATAKINFQKF